MISPVPVGIAKTRVRGYRDLFDYVGVPEKRELSMKKGAIYQRRHRAKMTPEQIAAEKVKNRAYRKAHREKTREWNNKYREENEERERQKRRAYKIRNREKNNESSRRLNVRRSREHKEYFINYKGGVCVQCGYKYTGENAAAFDFHHVNPVEKDTNLRMANSLARLQKEVEKCILLCSNCHRVLHASQELVQ